MRRWFILLLAALPLSAISVTIDGTGTGKTFDGIGVLSAGASSRLLIDYKDPYRSAILDYLFKPNYGAAIPYLKVEIGGDTNSTDGSEPSYAHTSLDSNFARGYEWWLMQQAKTRNSSMIFDSLPWGGPNWIGVSNQLSCDTSTNDVNYRVAFLQGASSTYGLSIGHTGVWNESNCSTGPNTWIKNLATAISGAGLSTVIDAADYDPGFGTLTSSMTSDSTLMSAISVVTYHYPSIDGGGGLPNPPPSAWSSKKFFAGEDGDWQDGACLNGNWTCAASLAQRFAHPYIDAKVTNHIIWAMTTSYYDNLPIPSAGLIKANTPWSGSYTVGPALWILAHWNQFATPGTWQYVDSGSDKFVHGCTSTCAGSYITLRSTSTSDYSVIIESISVGSSTSFTFTLSNGASAGVVHIWCSSSSQQFVRHAQDTNCPADQTPSASTWSITVPANYVISATTTTGQSKGSASGASSANFPFPWSDTFEAYALSRQPYYFADQDGSFEIVNCTHGHTGQCLQQAVSATPVPWPVSSYEPQPVSVAGDANMTDYIVQSDVMLQANGSVKLVGRCSTAFLFSGAGNLQCYELYVDQAGNYGIYNGDCCGSPVTGTTGTLGGGFGLNTWHTIALKMSGTTLSAIVDGTTVGTGTDSSKTAGQAGVGTSTYIQAQFDNLQLCATTGCGTPLCPGCVASASSVASGGVVLSNGAILQ